MSFPGRQLQRCWHLIDAKDQTVGRLAVQIATILRGKHKPTFMPNKDMGDTVVVINAEKVHFTGKKWRDKLYRWHTGYPGGLKQRTAEQMRERNPIQILRQAVFGMLQRNRLRHGYLEPRLKIFVGPTHPHMAQLPTGQVSALPAVPKRLHQKYHFGFGMQPYAQSKSYQQGIGTKI